MLPNSYNPPLHKSAFQRQKEELEERRKREQEEAAAIYSDFVASFETGNSGHQGFVRGSGSAPGPVVHQDSHFKPPKSDISHVRNHEPPIYRPEDPITSNPLKKRKLNEFIETIKRKQEKQPHEPKRHTTTTSYPELAYSSVSTNIFVGNLHPNIDESLLCQEFGIFGPIASVKIMWPRNPQEAARGHHSGFVSFMERGAAQRAYASMQGKQFFGIPIRLDWGKPVALPSTPIFVHEKHRHEAHRIHHHDPSEIQVKMPDDPNVLAVIHETIQNVIRLGSSFEQDLLESQSDNPTFNFLYDKHHPHHLYYKWKRWSLHKGESMDSWSTCPAIIDDLTWIPPPPVDRLVNTNVYEFPEIPARELIFPTSGDSDLDDDKLDRHATPRLRRRLHALCLNLLGAESLPRSSIARIMSLVIDSSECASDMAHELTRLTLRPNGSPTWQLHMLYVVADVLHNTTAPFPSAWKYRDAIQHHLPTIFDHLGKTYIQLRSSASNETDAAASSLPKGAPNKWRGEAWRMDVLAILSKWRQELLFPRDFLANLESNLKPHDDSDGPATQAPKNDALSATATSVPQPFHPAQDMPAMAQPASSVVSNEHAARTISAAGPATLKFGKIKSLKSDP